LKYSVSLRGRAVVPAITGAAVGAAGAAGTAVAGTAVGGTAVAGAAGAAVGVAVVPQAPNTIPTIIKTDKTLNKRFILLSPF
jgi:hypothetical protein